MSIFPSFRKWFRRPNQTPIQTRIKNLHKRHSVKMQLQQLEDRLAPASTALLNGGVDAIITGDGGANTFGMSLTTGGTLLQVTDTSTIVAGAGFTQVNANTVTVPVAAITGGDINVLAGLGADALTVNYGGGAIGLPIGYDGGTGGDALTVTGYSVATVTSNYTGSTSGNVVVGASPAINYTNLAPLDLLGTAANLIINLPTGNGDDMVELIGNGIAGDNISRLQSLAGVPTFEQTDFASPTATLTINLANDGETYRQSVATDLSTPAIIINGGTVADTINIRASNAANTTTVNAGGGLDIVNLGSTANLITPIAGLVVVNGDALGANVTVNDQGAAVAANYTVTSTTITRSTPAGFGGLTYGGLVAGNAVTLNTGSGANIIDVTSTANVITTVNSGGGNDTPNVTGGGLLGTTNIKGEANDDTFNVTGALAGGATLNIDGGTGAGDNMVVTGYNVTTVTSNYTGSTSGNVVVGASPAINYTNLAPLDLLGTAANLIINLPTGNGDDMVELIGNGIFGDNISRLQSLAGVPTFEMTDFTSPTASLTINLGNDGETYIQSVSLDLSTPNTVINGGTAADTVNIRASNAANTTTINGGAGLDNINLGSTGNLITPIAGPVVANGDALGANVTVNDQGAAVAANYTVTSTTITRSTPAGFGGLTYGGLVAGNAVTLNTGSGANIIAVTSTANVITTVNSGGGNDTLNVTGGGLLGTTNINGEANDDTFNVTIAGLGAVLNVNGFPAAGNDSLNVTGPGGATVETFNISNTQVTMSGPRVVNYFDIDNILLNTGGGADATVVSLDGAGIATSIVVNGTAGSTSLTVRGTAALDAWTVTPTDPTPGPTAPGLVNDTVVNVAGVSTVRSRGVAGNVLLDSNGGADTVVIRARTTTGGGDGLPEVANGNDTISITGAGNPGNQTIAITNATQGALQGIDLEDNDFTGGLTVNGGNETASDTFNVTASVDREITVNGGNPVTPVFPGDTLNYTGPTPATKTLTGPDSGTISAAGVQNVNYTSIENLNHTGAPGFNDDIDLTMIAGGQDGLPNLVQLFRNNIGGLDFLQVFIDTNTNDNGGVPNPVLFSTQLYDDVATISITGGTDNDRVEVRHNGTGGFLNRTINFDGNTGTDSLSIRGTPTGGLGANALETYRVGVTQDAGTWVIDPDGSGLRGSITPGPDGMIVNFTDLEPADSDTVVPTFDVVFNALANNLSILNGTLGAPFTTPNMRVVDNNASFETFHFANKTLVALHLNGGADVAAVDYTIAAAGLTTLEVYGNGLAGVGGVAADDNAAEFFGLYRSAGPTLSVFGQGGTDTFHNISFPGGGPFNMTGLAGIINITGGETAADSDFFAFSDALHGVGVLATLTNNQLTGAAPATINYFELERFYYESSGANDVIDVLSTNGTLGGTTYEILGDGGSDTFTIGNSTADFNAPVFDGSLDAILGTVLIYPDFNGSLGAADILNVDDSGTAALAGVADITNVGAVAGFFGDTGAATRLTNFAPATISYFHADITGGAGAGERLEFLNVRGSTGADTINVNATTAITATVVDAFTGDDSNTVTINGDALSAANTFNGNTGNDQFILNITAHLGETAVFPITSLEIHGNDPAADSNNRDRLVINDNNAGFVRDLNWDYLDTAADLDILANTAGAGLAGANNATMAVNVRTMETVIFNSTGVNDIVRVTGTSADDDLTVALLNNATSALVFLGGNPYTAAPPDSLATFLPGLAGGGNGPDLLLNGIDPLSKLTVDGDAGPTIGNRAIVQAASENDLTVPGGINDVFGFGVGVLIPGFGAGNAYDTIIVNDIFFNPNAVATFNNSVGPLVTVAVIPGSFVNNAPTPPRPGLIVNGGDEAVAQPSGIADDFSVTPHTLFNIQVNGNLPPLGPVGTDGLPVGDQLNLFSPTSFSIWSDKIAPPGGPNVSIQAGNNPFGVVASSIERTILFPGNGVINLIGDQNNPNIDQTDHYSVVGRNVNGDADGGFEEATIIINRSAPIMVDGMRFLNVYGYDLQGANLIDPGINAARDVPTTSATDDDIDTLEITPYADNTPRGWGVHVNYNEGVPNSGDPAPDGDPADLLIYHTSFFGGPVSEGIVVAPSAIDGGQLFSNNTAAGTPIVVIDYMNNTDIRVLDDDGFVADTDTLTLRGTNPDPNNTNVSGRESFVADFNAAGDAANPMVTVRDAASNAIMVRLQTFTNFNTINFAGLAGDDSFSIIGRDNGTLTVNIDGGNPGASDTILVPGTDAGTDTWTFSPGAASDAGTIAVRRSTATADTIINYTGSEAVNVDAGGINGVDNFTFNGTGGPNAFTLTGTGAGTGNVRVDAGVLVSYSNLGGEGVTVTLNGSGGDDSFSINPATNPGIGTVNINGGAPSASDSATFTLANTDDTVTYTPISANQGTLVVTNGGSTTYNLTDVEGLNVDARDASADSLTVDVTVNPDANFVHTPGEESGSGAAVVYLGPGHTNGTLPINYRHFESVNFAARTAIITGTGGDDLIVVDRATGAVTVNGNTTNYAGTNAIIINALGGDDTITVNAGVQFPGGVAIIGGANGGGSDSVIVNGQSSNDDITVDLLAGTVDDTISSPVSLTGIEHLTVNGNGAIGGDSISVTGLGSVSGLASVTLNGNGGTPSPDTMSVSGTSGPDLLNFNPTDADSGQVTRTGTATTVNYTGITGGTFTISGGTGGFDVLTVLGTEGADSVTSTATTVTRDGTVTIGAGIDRLDILGLGGNDNIILTGLTIAKIVDGGTGDDTIDLSASVDADIFGGIGDDVIIGSPAADYIDAGQGNDTVTAGGGNDTVFASEGSDTINFSAGDGTDVTDGGAGSDRYVFNGAAGDDAVVVTGSGSAATIINGADQATIALIERLTINTGASAAGDAVTINSLALTDVKVVDIDGDAPAGADLNADVVTLNGTDSAESVTVGTDPVTSEFQVLGLGPVINLLNFFIVPDNDNLRINLLGGNDSLTQDAAIFGSVNLDVDGGNGNDVIAADGDLTGGLGNDTLIGGPGANTINGGTGDDVIFGNGGTDSVTGGLGSDTILVEGTPGDDTINISLNGAGDLVVSVNGNTTTYSSIAGASVELINVLGLAGSDALTVDSANGAIPVPINFDGGNNADSLTLTGGTATSDVYTPGPNAGQGTSVVVIGGGTQTVTFSNLEPVTDNVAGPLTVNANNASNAINFAGNVISVDALETIAIANKTDVAINGLSGSDTINISTPTSFTGTLTVDGGNPTGSDTLIVNGTAATVTVDTGASTITGAAPAAINYAGIEHLTVVAGASTNLAVSGSSNYTHTPGTATDAGRVQTDALAVDYTGFGAAATINVGPGALLTANGTSADDNFNVVSVSVALTGRAVLITNGIANLRVLGLDGDDTFNVAGDLPYTTVNIQGGNPSASDTLNFNALVGGTITVDLANRTVSQAGFNPVSFTGVEVLNVTDIFGGNDILVVGAPAADQISVTPTGPNTATITRAGLNLVVNTDNTGTLTIDAAGAANDSVTVNGTGGGDTINVDRTAGTVQVVGLKIVTLIAEETLVVAAGLGSDTINVTGAGGPASLVIDGGLPTTSADTLGVTDPTVTVNYGADPTSGLLNTTGGDINFLGIEIISLTGDTTGSVTVNGTNGNDAINQSGNTVTVNNGAAVTFAAYPALNLNGLAGDDSINLHSATLVGVTTLNVDGGDPTGSDTLIVNGTGGADTITYQPTGLASGTVSGLGSTVSFGGMEHLTIDGQSGFSGDALTINTFFIGGTQVLTPGPSFDSGRVDFRDGGTGTTTAVALDFLRLGSGGSLTLSAAGRFDNLIYNGTALNDTFSVDSAGQVLLNNRIAVNTPSIITLTLAGLDGDDTFNIAGNHNLPGIVLQGGNPSASDTVNFGGSVAVADTTVDLAVPSVTQAGFGSVSLSGVEVLNVSAGANAINVSATSADDNVTVTPTGADTATATAAGLNLTVNTTNTGALNLDLLGGSDHLTMNGTQAGEAITVTGALVTVAGRKTVNYLDTENLRVNGLAGSDTFNVTPSATTGIFLDGGDPIGVTPGDNITIGGPATLNPGPEGDEGSLETAGNQPVSFDHIESITINSGGGGGAIINGTNGNDAITIIARDASTHAGADGVQDFTVTVNNGPTVLYLNTSAITVNALGGDDVITVRTPAPNGAVWDVDVTIDGGTPTASDKVVIETTAGSNHAASYTPSGINSGTFVLNDLSSTISLTDVELLTYNNVNIADADTLTVTTANAVIIPGANVGDGVVNPTDATGNALLSLTYLHVASATVSGTTAVIQGTAESDTITVSSAGVVTIANALGFNNSVNVSGFANLVINALGGDDVINVPGSTPFTTIRVIGGSNGGGSDSLLLTGAAATVESVNIAPDGTIPGQQSVTGLSAAITVSGTELIRYTGVGGDDTLTVDTGAGNDTVRVDGGNSRDVVTSNSLPKIEFSGLGTFVLDIINGIDTATFATRNLLGAIAANYQIESSGGDTLIIEGADGINDSFTVTDPAGSSPLAVTDNSSGVTVTNTIGFVPVGRLQINTLGGNDTLTVDNSSGLVTVPIGFDGGNGADTLRLIGSIAVTSDVYSVGPYAGSGSDVMSDGVATQTVSFTNLEPVIDLVAGPLVVNGTNASNAINYTQGSIAANGLVSVDGFETIEFSNKTTLTINGLAGSDTINLNNPTTPAGLTGITVNAGDPTGSDTLIVNGTTGSDTIGYNPSGIGAGSVTVNALPTVNFTTTEHVVIDGQGGTDALTLTTPAGVEQVTYTPGAAPDAGTIATRGAGGGTGLVPITFSHIGAGGSVTFASAGGREDVFELYGTNDSDIFNINQIADRIQILNPTGGFVTVDLNTDGINLLELRGLNGDDDFNLAATLPYAAGTLVDGGNPAASDTLNLSGATGAIVENLATQTVTGYGGTVSLLGVEHLNLSATGSAATLTVDATAGSDTLHYTPTDTTAGTITRAGQNLTTTFTGVAGAFTLDAGLGSDTVTINGTSGSDTISVARAATTTVTVNALKAVDLPAANTEALVIAAGLGDDNTTVTGSAGPASVTIDGGLPTASDTLDVSTSADASVTYGADPSSGVIGDAASGNVSFTGTEIINLTGAGGGTLTVNGTNANDAINQNGNTVTVNNGAVVNFATYATLTLNGLNGDDVLSVRPATLAGVTTLNVDGGDPTDSDKLILTGTAGADSITYRPSGLDSGDVTGLGAAVAFSATEALVIDGQSNFAGDTLIVDTVNIDGTQVLTPGSTFDSGTVNFRDGGFAIVTATALQYKGLGSGGSLTFTDIGPIDTLVYNGTNASDTFGVNAAGDVSLNTQIVVHTPGIANLTLKGLDGDDVFNLAGALPFTGTTVDGGNPSASDIVILSGASGAVTITLGDSSVPTNTTVTGFGGTVTLTGAEVADANAGAQNIAVVGTGNPDSLSVTPTGTNTATITAAGLNLTINTTNTGASTLTLDGAGGSDTVTINGQSDADSIAVVRGATTTVQVDALKTISVTAGSTEALVVNAGAGNDTITVSGVFGTATHLTVDGGSPNNSSGGNDRLIVNTATGTTTVSPGSTPDAGTVDVPAAGAAEDVGFVGMENLTINGAAAGDTLVMNGTHASDTIALQNLGGNNLVWINDRAVVIFTSFGTVTLAGRFGDDKFSVSPVGLVGVTTVNVNGGDPTGSDALLVSGTSAAETITYQPSGLAAGAVTITGSPVISFTTTESLVIDGGSNFSGDSLIVDTINIDGTQVLTPDSTFDSGRVDFRDGGFAIVTAPALQFKGLGSGGSLTFTDIGRIDTLIYNGTEQSDTFSVAATTGAINLNTQVVVNTPGIANLVLVGLGGNDTFELAGALPYTTTRVDAGSPSASDIVNLAGATGAVTVNLAAQTVTGYGGTVILSGVEILNVNAMSNTLSVVATGSDDNVTVTVLSATSGRLVDGISLLRLGEPPQAAHPPVVNYSAITGPLGVDLAGGVDRLAIVGNALGQTFNINDSEVPVVLPGYVVATPANTVEVDNGNNLSIDGAVTYSNNEALQVAGLEGNDTFQIAPGATPNSVPIFIDGGDPIGTTAGDTIVIFAPALAVSPEAGPERDEGGFVIGGAERVSYDHIEAIVIFANCALILGTNGDDDITIIARDAATHPILAAFTPGVRDFTTVVNDQIEILWVDTPDLHVDALAGDDDIVLRTPAPNNAVWDVNVFSAGGSPSARTGDQGDVFELETPFQQNVTYTPTGSDSGVIEVANVAAGHIATITLGTFTGACPPLNYNSSVGGVEEFDYDGEGANDRFTIIGTSGNDTIIHTPGAGTDEGSLRVNNLLGVNYQNLGGGATLTASGGTAGTDTLVYDGTDLGDTFTVVATTGAVDLTNSHGNRLDLNQTGIETLTLEGLSGDDGFIVNYPQPYGTINVNGGDPGASDSLTIIGAVGVAEAFTVSPGLVPHNGVVTVNAVAMPYVGVEHLFLVANSGVGDADNLTVNDDRRDNTWNVSSGTRGDLVQIDGRESIDDDSFVNVTLSNLYGTDVFNIYPTKLISFTGIFTVNGDVPADDVLNLYGTPGADLVTAAASAITVNGVTITSGTNLVRTAVHGLAGNDSITLTSYTALPTTIDGGDGDDTIIGTPQADLIFGGSGNDILIGGAGVDTIYGQDGNDIFSNPTTTANGVADDPGADFLDGGQGIDNFVWEPGDGSDIISGGADGADILRFNGSTTSVAGETFNVLAAPAAPTHLNVVFGAATVDAHGVETVILNTFGGADTVFVGDLTPTEVENIDVVFGNADGALDNLFVDGRALDDDMLISVASGPTVKIAGLDYDVRLQGATVGEGDRLTVRGNEGDDRIKANAGVEAAVNLTLNGNDGNDYLSADAIINGGAGDDTLVGGAGADELHGDAGEDLLIGGGGIDTFDGGANFDTILLSGSSGNDTFILFQDAPTGGAGDNYSFSHRISLNGAAAVTFTEFITKTSVGVAPNDPINRPTVEEIRIVAGKGNDLIGVQHADEYMDLLTTNGVQAQTLRFDVHGDEPSAGGDRLVVNDAGPGDLTLIRYSADITQGRITMAPFLASGAPSGMADIVFQGIERIDVTPQSDPINPTGGTISGEGFGTGSDGNGRVVIFHEDPYESNDSRLTAGELSRIGTSVNSPTIDPGGITTPFPANGDEDWYEFRPRETGTYQVKILFDRITSAVGGLLGNSRPGLPATGDLALQIYDAFGNLIVTGVHDTTGPDVTNNRAAIFAATNDPIAPQFNRIFVRVRGADGARLSITPYDFDNIPGLGTGLPGVTDVDIFGPQVTNVQISSSPAHNLFGLKPDGTTVPTPVVNSITISFRDLPARAPGFLYPALDPITASTPGTYVVRGDKTGIIPISSITVVNNPVVLGGVPTATVTLVFADPLPDDRLTLTINDNLLDPALNKLDGESNAAEPHNTPTFPSGDGHAGGDFVARFTVDTRPEIGAWAGTVASIDINGNGVWDPQAEGDTTNRDLQFKFGLASDHIFAGNFNVPGSGVNGGFVKLGAYGKQKGAFRFLLDFNGDGIPDANIKPSLKINGTPIAGNFNPANPGDEIGLFDGKTWYLDTNGNNNIDGGDAKIKGGLRGIPIVGDFDGDGVVDLATYQPDNNLFQFDLAASGYGNLDAVLTFGFPGVRERPVAADMDQDGITDVGLYIPGNATSADGNTADWFFLVSAGNPVYNRVPLTPDSNDVFAPAPLGSDLHYTFGNNFAIPIVGNFDPPLVRTISPQTALNLTQKNLTSALLSANLQLTGNGSSAGLVSRYSARGDMYWAGIVARNDSFFVEIRRKLKGQWRTLKSKEVSTGVGALTFVTRGTSLQAYLNGALVVSTSDRMLAKGFYGTLSTQGTQVTNMGAR